MISVKVGLQSGLLLKKVEVVVSVIQKRGKKWCILSVSFLFLASCTTTDEVPEKYTPYLAEDNPAVMVDVFLTTQGMIEGLILSGKLTVQNALVLLKQDQLTRNAVLRQGLYPSMENMEEAAKQMKTLLAIIHQIGEGQNRPMGPSMAPVLKPGSPALPPPASKGNS
ncbi:hypothetical protein [Entomobacter blattae]|uniref:Uncharacterized protein n=1 Tax=Entomobacter blattae TaxID=2762277 RepID=A0A7H1NS19_9PROT|nr:hypothetical protein [Entomobacter blattae]QNT78579.1 hypothetical protein JGUZn3_13530 [Entomobacter blattae]